MNTELNLVTTLLSDGCGVCVQEKPRSNSLAVVLKAANFAAVKHRDHRGRDPHKSPYVNHPIGVSHILMNEALVDDGDVLAAALLHDTVEYTDTSFDELESEFGVVVMELVKECTDDMALERQVRWRLQVETAGEKSRGAKLIKLADKLDNLRRLELATPVGWTEQRLQQYYCWAKEVVEKMKGVNEILDKTLAELLDKKVAFS